MRAVEPRARARADLFWLPLVGGCAGIAPAYSAVEFEPAVSVGVAQTDNLTLVAQDPERETVYQLLPSFTLEQDSPRMTTDMSYSADAFYYKDRSDSDVFHILSAASQLALDKDNFFLDLGATRDQSIRDPESPIARSNLPITTNRLDRDDFYVGTSFDYAFGNSTSLGGIYRNTRSRYHESETESASVAVDEFDSENFDLAVDNYRKERGFAWAVGYREESTDYEGFLPWEYRQASVEIGAWVRQGLRLFAAGGSESAWDQPMDPSLSDDFWEVGFATRGQSLAVELAAGERSFGSSQRVTLDYTFGRGMTRVSYTEQPATEGRDPYGGLVATDSPSDALEDLLARPGAAQLFLLSRFDWNLTFDLRSTQLSLAVFDETRKDRMDFQGTPLEDEAQKGGSLSFDWDLGAKTALVVRADKWWRQFGTDEQELKSLSIGGEYRLGARTDLSLYLTRTEEDSLNDAIGQEYEADLISLLLTRRFTGAQ